MTVSVRLSIAPLVHRSVNPVIRRSDGLLVRWSVRPSIHPSVHPSFRPTIRHAVQIHTKRSSHLRYSTCPAARDLCCCVYGLVTVLPVAKDDVGSNRKIHVTSAQTKLSNFQGKMGESFMPHVPIHPVCPNSPLLTELKF